MKNCAICLQEIKDLRRCWLCTSIYCKSCINKWCEKNNSCPCCRATPMITANNTCLYQNKRSYKSRPRWLFTIGDDLYYILPVMEGNKLRGHVYSTIVKEVTTKNCSLIPYVSRSSIASTIKGTVVLKLRAKHPQKVLKPVLKHLKRRSIVFSLVQNHIIIDHKELKKYLHQRGRFF